MAVIDARQSWREFRAYGLASGLALVVDVVTLLLLAQVVHYLWAATAGFVLGALTSYGLAVTWVFPVRRFAAQPRAEFVVYVLVGLAGLGLNNAIIYVAVEAFGAPLLGAKGLAAVITFLFNFAVRKGILFRA